MKQNVDFLSIAYDYYATIYSVTPFIRSSILRPPPPPDFFLNDRIFFYINVPVIRPNSCIRPTTTQNALFLEKKTQLYDHQMIKWLKFWAVCKGKFPRLELCISGISSTTCLHRPRVCIDSGRMRWTVKKKRSHVRKIHNFKYDNFQSMFSVYTSTFAGEISAISFPLLSLIVDLLRWGWVCRLFFLFFHGSALFCCRD